MCVQAAFMLTHFVTELGCRQISNMPYKCCVYNCSSNYITAKGEYVTVYRFPKDIVERDRWIKCLPNKIFVYSESKRVCCKHWPSNAKMKNIRGGSSVPIDAPSVFEG